MEFIRQKFPHLSDFPDLVVRDMNYETIHQLNNSIGAQSEAHRKAEPNERVLHNLNALQKPVPAGQDNRNTILHPARFLGGPVCSNQRLWQQAREYLGPQGVEPLANFDLRTIGLGGHVTTRGWVEIHNPGSTNLTLKLFSIKNVANSTRGTQHFALADSDCVVSQGESLLDIVDLDNFKTAVRAAEVAQQLATPWNKSITALNSFIIASDYCAKDLTGRANRAGILTEFVNYVFTQNAENWRSGDPFLSTTDISTHWAQWFGASAASRIMPQQPEKKKFFFTQRSGRSGSRRSFGAGHDDSRFSERPQDSPAPQPPGAEIRREMAGPGMAATRCSSVPRAAMLKSPAAISMLASALTDRRTATRQQACVCSTPAQKMSMAAPVAVITRLSATDRQW
jgi:hypothetical protein